LFEILVKSGLKGRQLIEAVENPLKSKYTTHAMPIAKTHLLDHTLRRHLLGDFDHHRDWFQRVEYFDHATPHMFLDTYVFFFVFHSKHVFVVQAKLFSGLLFFFMLIVICFDS